MRAQKKIADYFNFLRGNILTLVVSEVIIHNTSSIASPFLSLYIFALGGTTTNIGQINAMANLSRAPTRILGGYLADKMGRKNIIAIMTLAVGVIYLFFIFAIDFLLINSYLQIYEP